MKTDLKVFFSSRFLCLLVLISLFARLFFQFIFLPKTPSEYGPDEGAYAALAKYVADGLPVQEFPGFGPDLYYSARTLILPSSTLIKIGINDLLAVRLTSTLAGLISLIMLSLCIIAIQNLLKEKDGFAPFKLNKGQRLVLIIFTLLPSNFLWSNLGLRESLSQLYLIAFTYFSIKILSPKVDRKPLYSILSSISLMLAFGARQQTALIFSLLAFVFGLILVWKLKNFWILLAIFVGFTTGSIFTATPSVELKTSLITKKISIGESKLPTTIATEALQETSKLCLEEGQILNLKSGRYECLQLIEYKIIKRNFFNSVQQLILTTQILDDKRNGNRVGATSALPESTCDVSIWKIPSEFLCSLIELPYSLSTFLFRPLPLIDSGSNFLNLAGIENLFWLGLIIYAAFAPFNKNLNKGAKFLIIWLYSYIITFSTAASLYEGNLGTAFRHKSSILWALALGLLISHKDFKLKGRDSKSFKYRHSKKE
jgi:hypothetical protein